MYKIVYLFILVTIISCNKTNNDSIRTIENFDNDWFFTLNDSTNLFEESHKESDWSKIRVPHDWSIEAEPSMDNPSGKRGGYVIGGIGWYKKTFEVPVEQRQKNIVLLFEGVYKDADIWVNNHHVSFHKHGYLSFNLDITDYIQFDNTNTILIKINNSDLPHDRWYSGSGIYRHVWINYLSDVHIPIWGTYITTSEITIEKAVVDLKTTITNKSQVSEVKIETSIANHNGEIVCSQLIKNQKLNDTTNISQSLIIDNPRLWTLDDPYMYKSIQKIYIKNTLIDEFEMPFGIRSIEYSVDKGFILNGDSIFLKGVNIHHDAGSEGSAVSDHTWYTRLLMLKEMGVNTIRLSHNPHSPHLLNMCDTMGILLISEAFDKWGEKRAFGFRKHWKKYTKDFIDRDRNHPSVIMWSLGNEVSEAKTTLGPKIMKGLADFVHEYEPTRPVTVAIRPPGHADNYKPSDMAFEMDIVSLNYQSQFYAQDKERYNFIILGSEMLPYYTRNNIGLLKGEMEKYLPINSYIESEKHSIGHIIWAGIDYLGEAAQPWPLKGWENAPINTAGFKKPFFYFMQSLYSDKPMVHIAVRDKENKKQIGKYGWDWPIVASHWNWTKADTPLEIFLYSNCDSVELILNGKSLGLNKEKDPEKLYFEYQAAFEAGEILAKGMKDGKEYYHKLNTAKKAHSILLSASRNIMPAHRNETCHIIAEIVDENGIKVQHKNHVISFSIEGSGEIIGVDNGDMWSTESYKSIHRETRNGECLAIVKANEKGKITVNATAEGLISNSVVIEIK
ncbi:MAG: DUF4982 domain-containing protein [Cyclobacteriaceae bacterium]|nr:DUF4982 domain-containing protein [Cyclobacteriaceae bacterium]